MKNLVVGAGFSGATIARKIAEELPTSSIGSTAACFLLV
jgi:UDP-galactopyranose mutase